MRYFYSHYMNDLDTVHTDSTYKTLPIPTLSHYKSIFGMVLAQEYNIIFILRIINLILVLMSLYSIMETFLVPHV